MLNLRDLSFFPCKNGTPSINIPCIKLTGSNKEIITIFVFNHNPYAIIGNSVCRITGESDHLLLRGPLHIKVYPNTQKLQDAITSFGEIEGIDAKFPMYFSKSDIPEKFPANIWYRFTPPRTTIMTADGSFYRIGSRNRKYYIEQTGGKKFNGQLTRVFNPLSVTGDFIFQYIPEGESPLNTINGGNIITIYVETDPRLQ